MAVPVKLEATEKFRSHKKTAEKRIFELVNSKIDDLIETAEYDWMATAPPTEPSNYMQTLTRYLSNIMASMLLSLPSEIKELIYFDALSHAADMIIVRLPSSPATRIESPTNSHCLVPSPLPHRQTHQSLWRRCPFRRRSLPRRLRHFP